MSVRLRLRRIGKKKHPCYRVAVVDSRTKRDGRFVEFVGRYDPMTDPQTIEFKDQRVLEWLNQGATYSDTVGSLLRQSGLLARWHEQRTGQKAEKTVELKPAAKKPVKAQAAAPVEAPAEQPQAGSSEA